MSTLPNICWAAPHALFIAHVNNSVWFDMVYYSELVLWRKKKKKLVTVTFSSSSSSSSVCAWDRAEVEADRFPAQLHSPSKGFKDWEPTLSAGQGKAHLSQLCSIKEKMWWPFTFFLLEEEKKKKHTSHEEREAEVDLRVYSFSG